MFHGGIPGGDDCPAAGATSGCGHLIAGPTRVWETISGAAATVPTSAWYVTNNPTTQNMTKQTLGNRSFIESGQVFAEIPERRYRRHKRCKRIDQFRPGRRHCQPGKFG